MDNNRTFTKKEFIYEIHRGYKVIITIYCEKGHLYKKIFAFHKGYIYISYELISEIKSEEAIDKMNEEYPELWRD